MEKVMRGSFSHFQTPVAVIPMIERGVAGREVLEVHWEMDLDLIKMIKNGKKIPITTTKKN